MTARGSCCSSAAANNGGDALLRRCAAGAARGAGRRRAAPRARARGRGWRRSAAPAGGCPGHCEALAADRADLVVDGMLGIGGSGGLRTRRRPPRRGRRGDPATIVAVDVPSGVDADTGAVAGRGRARRRHGHLRHAQAGAARRPRREPRRARRAGRHRARRLRTPSVGGARGRDVAAMLPGPGCRERQVQPRGARRGSPARDAYTGAAVLARGRARCAPAPAWSASAARTSPPGCVRSRWPEVVVGDGRVQAHLAGPGGAPTRRPAERLDAVLAAGLPTVVDADALTLLAAADGTARRPRVLTPHAGEAARLLGAERADVEARRLEHALETARRYAVVVLLKGSTTVVAAPDERVRVNPTGTAVAGHRRHRGRARRGRRRAARRRSEALRGGVRGSVAARGRPGAPLPGTPDAGRAWHGGPITPPEARSVSGPCRRSAGACG